MHIKKDGMSEWSSVPSLCTHAMFAVAARCRCAQNSNGLISRACVQFYVPMSTGRACNPRSNALCFRFPGTV